MSVNQKTIVDISELPDELRNPGVINLKDISQLRYVVEMSEKICPHVGLFETKGMPELFLQGGTCIFLKRYFEGKINTSFKNKYQTTSDLLNTLSAYDIDPSAFWYLILFIKDYVDDESTGKKQVDSPYTQIFNLASKIHEMEFNVNSMNGEYQGCVNKGELKLHVGKHWVVDITDDKALFGIYRALLSYIRKAHPKRRKELIDGVWEETNAWEHDMDFEYLFVTSQEQPEETITIPETYKISYFATQMMKFLKQFKTSERNNKISTDKWLLISRVIFIIEYSSDVRYNKRRKEDHVTRMNFLKGNYKKDRYPDEVRREIYV